MPYRIGPPLDTDSRRVSDPQRVIESGDRGRHATTASADETTFSSSDTEIKMIMTVCANRADYLGNGIHDLRTISAGAPHGREIAGGTRRRT